MYILRISCIGAIITLIDRNVYPSTFWMIYIIEDKAGPFASALVLLASSSALEPTSAGLQRLLKTSGDIQPCELNGYRILGLSVHRRSLLD